MLERLLHLVPRFGTVTGQINNRVRVRRMSKQPSFTGTTGLGSNTGREERTKDTMT